ncbi:unnamed protein product [Medioppia subpectinata]|uniref:Transporter n=1 Tax=Medioppia subpectinata TaxID=1979941 RepID=A0A7R9KFT6_9ACAR|nr:unnamed protein product [Medioppia subpectinata]CAG2102584.1 unnamed protein product [Medioppia subpectinata]
MSSLSIENIDTIIDDKAFSDVGVQVDLTSRHSFRNKSHFVDLGYDSLHSTPKLLSGQKVHSKHFDNNEEMDDNISENSSIMISKWKQKFSKFRTQLAIRKICKNNERNNTKALRKTENSEMDKIENGEPEQRVEWSKKIDFLLSIIGFAVDLSNVWRFPYLCYKNGGGVFLIPYTTMLIFGALPLFFLELSAGQFTKCGPITMWNKLCPPMKGIGYCCVLISWYVSFYYNVIIAWTTYYIIKTLTSGDLMPWQHCGNDYNTPNCFSVSQMQAIQCNTTDDQNPEDPGNCVKINLTNRSSPTEEFFWRGLLEIDKSDGLTGMGTLRPELIGCLVIVFIVLYFSLFKGVKSSGKVVWFTATAPYFILTILLIRGLFLPGAVEGILYYINPRLEKLLEPSVWVDAAVQVFYSIGVGFGVHLTYASFNKFNNNCYRDCLITACVNSLTSFYSGFVIFTYLGYMAQSMNKEIQNVASEGYGLVFQVYPEAISTLPFAKFWSLLFFIMLLTLGIDSAV